MLTRAHYAFIGANFLKKHIHKCTLFCCHRINFWELFCSVWSVQYCRFSFCWCFACCWDGRPAPLPVRVLAAVVAQHSSAGWYPAAAYLSRWGGGWRERWNYLRLLWRSIGIQPRPQRGLPQPCALSAAWLGDEQVPGLLLPHAHPQLNKGQRVLGPRDEVFAEAS